ncbi:canalicular multispecific organic anion transporter 1 [Plakobranchus ocellatus]|uniref:ABC-type glutathione-S-conjugate transporter n=1 Tax=Plakobranchus ocellatus TaxID=259542 RepID=A0AAV4AFS5_9GAST|nr:canalicular multispecific organic anion transporter 1 [Plakobranchus ocellatus]
MAANATHSGFCDNSAFWDTDLLLNSSYPKFTQCFQDTALVWGPCGALWLITPFYLLYMARVAKTAGSHSISTNSFNVFKTILILLLIAVSIARLVKDASQDYVPTVKYISGAVYIVTFILVAVLMHVERRYGFVTSGVLFVVFSLLVVAGVVPVYTGIVEKDHSTQFYLACAYFVILLFEYLLLFKADHSYPRGHYTLGARPQCPEMLASFPNQLTYFWIISLIRLGYKKALAEEDVPTLNPRDQSATVLPPFEKAWYKERRRCMLANRARNPNSDSPERLERVSYVRRSNDVNGANEKTRLLGQVPRTTVQDGSNRGEKKPSLTKVILKVFGGALFVSQFLKLISDGLTFVTPLLIDELLAFTTDRENQQEWKGYILACAFFVVCGIKSIFYQYHFHVSMALGMRVKNAVICAVYKKALTISNEAKRESTSGEIVNLMSVDCQRIQDVMGFVYMVWSMPLMIVIALYMLWGTLGPASMAGLAVLVLLLPTNMVVAYKQKAYQVQLMKIKDSRIKVMNEVLNGMKVLKLYAWEESFLKKISKIRNDELNILKKSAYLSAFSTFVWTCAPYMVQLASFGAYIAISSSGYLDASTAFVSISLFGILNMPMSALPMIIPMLIQASVSIGRVSKFLSSEDLDPNVVMKDSRSDAAVKIKNGIFTWDTQMPQPTLSDINVHIKPGSLVAVVGTVGSGKSSLLSAMLGEMKKIHGIVTLKDRLAYVPQEAWIQNATLRDNILFGNGFSKSKYKQVLHTCALEADLAILPGGDSTEIGEKGINLSGGQKQRVSLARAVYSDADTYLLDDPLSAVDAHVGKHIFTKVISNNGALKDKTRILVTHGIHWLPMVDHIIVMSRGRISEEGTYEELISHEGAFASFLKEFFRNEAEAEVEEVENDDEIEEIKSQVLQRLESVTSDNDFTSGDELSGGKEAESFIRQRRKSRQSLTRSKSIDIIKEEPKKSTAGTTLIEEEKAETGNVTRAVFLKYIHAVGALVFLSMTLIFTLYQTSSTYSAIWLSMWTDDPLLANTSMAGSSDYNNKNIMYLTVYALLGLAQGATVLTFALVSASRMVKASGQLHMGMLDNVLRSPMSFYDTTPMGRVLNRFSRDVDTVDSALPATIRSFYQCIFRVTGTIITIAYSTPIFLIVVLPLGLLYWFIQRFYIPTSRQLRRIESTTRSPIYVHFSETVSGAASIRAYGVQERFVSESRYRTDNNLSFYFASLVANRWLGWCLEMIGNLVVLSSALFAVLSRNLAAGLVGLSVSYSTQVTGALNYLVRTFSELETNIVSVERIKEYCETPTEAAWINPYNRPGPSWPDQGKIHFKDYQTRYRPGLELVLKGVTCRINSGEKVGIVGRTGAGKSSLTVALFRLIEAASGSIIIDNIPIGNIGLHDLRSRLTILPQDPVIFSGTLRMNLDPFDEFSDDEIWRALEHAHLKDFVSGLPGMIQYECGEGGSNLSVGQRQLLCLARTLVRQTQILILDEATAAVDLETDELIQKTIRSQFSGCTVLAIAHRLNTVMDYDKIMVMDKGRVSEFASPADLLANTDSIFYGMAKDAGLV